jgi:hypothetical protein
MEILRALIKAQWILCAFLGIYELLEFTKAWQWHERSVKKKYTAEQQSLFITATLQTHAAAYVRVEILSIEIKVIKNNKYKLGGNGRCRLS